MRNKNNSSAPDRDYLKLAAWFLGPKGENGEMFEQLLQTSVEEHVKYRKEHYKANDPEYITDDMKNSAEYQAQVEKLRAVQRGLCAKLHGSVPFYTPRYQGHMLWDTVIPGMMGYMTAMLYNQNNVASEASPATSRMELEAATELCEMLGYDQTTSWGHITADGSIANLESMWAARNMKYYPLAIKEMLENISKFEQEATKLQVLLPDGKTQKTLCSCSEWELLNLDEDTVLQLGDKIKADCGLTDDEFDGYLERYQIQNKGLAYYARKYPDMKEPKIFVPATNHYSWPKSATVLGLGKDCVEGIPVDAQCRMNSDILEKRIAECADQQIPVIMVVNVIGSTEEGAVDNLCGTLNLREQMAQQNMYFHVHCDAAWGGYLKSMIVRPKGALRDESGYVPFLPMSEFGRTQYENLHRADTITIDPHKAGFIPYPAGSLCYRNQNLRSMITFNASYIASDKSLNMGIYGLEGSKPGASAAAVWTAHKVIPLDTTGYGRLLGECSFSAKRYYCQWVTLADESDDFEIRMLVKMPEKIKIHGGVVLGEENIKKSIRTFILGKSNEEIAANEDAMTIMRELGTDVLINSFVVNFKVNGEWNHDPVKLNQLNKAIFDKFSILDPQTAEKDDVDYILMQTELDTETYAEPLKGMMKVWGINLTGVPTVNCLINTIMNPWSTTNGFIDRMSETFKCGIEECIGNIKKKENI